MGNIEGVKDMGVAIPFVGYAPSTEVPFLVYGGEVAIPFVGYGRRP